jgi:hypothetical protein
LIQASDFAHLKDLGRYTRAVESGDIQVETDSHSGTTTAEIHTCQSGQKRIIWTLVEEAGMKRGVAGKYIFRWRTRTSLPLHAEINVSARYLKGGKTKVFEIPGIEYTLLP